jgi:hypothetical protein
MATRKNRSLEPLAPVNFLLTCSASILDSFELTKLGNVSNLRTELHDILDKLIDEATQAALARWFKVHGREELKDALDNPPDVIAEAREKVRALGRTKDERTEERLTQVFSLPPGQAHRTASMTYQERNIAEGKCSVCPRLLARHSVRYCEKHLAACRERARQKSRELDKPPHGRAPGTLAMLAQANHERKLKQLPEEIGKGGQKS